MSFKHGGPEHYRASHRAGEARDASRKALVRTAGALRDSSDSAHRASVKASKSGLKEDHKAAQSKHEKAAGLHDEESKKRPGRYAQGEDLLDRRKAFKDSAEAHRRAADQHGRASGEAKDPRSSTSPPKAASGKKLSGPKSLKSAVEKLKGDQNAVELTTPGGTKHRIRNADDLREFLADGGQLPKSGRGRGNKKEVRNRLWSQVANCPGPLMDSYTDKEDPSLDATLPLNVSVTGSLEDRLSRVAQAFRAAHPLEYDSANGRLLPAHQLVAVFDAYVICRKKDSYYRQEYALDAAGSVRLKGSPRSVRQETQWISL